MQMPQKKKPDLWVRMERWLQSWIAKSTAPSVSPQRRTVDTILAVVLAVGPTALGLTVFWRWLAWLFCFALVLGYVLPDWVPAVRAFPKKSKRLVFGLSVLLFVIGFYPIAKVQWREEKAGAMTGRLIAPTSDEQFDDSNVKIQIGASPDGSVITWTGGNTPIFNVVGDKLSVHRKNGKLYISTQVRERGTTGPVVVNITDNVWTISSEQSVSWDHNYTSNSLEVKDGRGRIVFQVVLTPRTVRIQGEWWNENGNGERIVRPYPYDPVKIGPVLVYLTPFYQTDDPPIEPIFKYPSREHWGEFADWYRP